VVTRHASKIGTNSFEVTFENHALTHEAIIRKLFSADTNQDRAVSLLTTVIICEIAEVRLVTPRLEGRQYASDDPDLGCLQALHITIASPHRVRIRFWPEGWRQYTERL